MTAERALCLPVSQLKLSFRLLWPLLPPRMLTLPGSWCEISSNPMESIQLSFLPWTFSLQNSISCLSGAHTWRLLPPGLRLSLLRHVSASSSLAVPQGCCVSHMTAAGFSFHLLALWALLLPCSLFSAEPVLEGRELYPHSLCHCGYLHPNPGLAMKISLPNDCTAFAKVWGLLSAALHSVQLQGSVPISGAMALRGAGVHPSSFSLTALGGG